MAIITEHPDRDAPATVDTPYAMTVGDRFRGELTGRADVDWVRIELTAGETYTLTLGGIGPGPVSDTVLTVYDAGGQVVARNDDVVVGARQFHSELTFTPATTGAYSLSAAAYTGNPDVGYAGRYELRVYDAAGVAPRTLTGTAGSDAFLAGGPGDDTLNGAAGDDVLAGGPGADRLSGGPGADTAWYGYSGSAVSVRLDDGTAYGGDAEGDTFASQRVTQTDVQGRTHELSVPDIENLYGSAHDDTLSGNALPNTLGGDDGDDTLAGGGGNDWLTGGAGADTLIGGPGFDAVSYARSPAGVTVHLYDGTAYGGHADGDTFPGRTTLRVTDAAGVAQAVEVADIEYLDGSAYNDVLAGDRGPDRIEGRGGNDRLDGRGGDDWLEGEAGADTLSGGPGQDTASYRYSDAGVSVRLHNASAKGGHATGDTFALITEGFTGGDRNARRVTLPDIEHLHGSAHDDVLAGDIRANTLNGGAGNDTLYGGPDGGDDILVGGTGRDRLYGGAGDDTLHGGDGHDTLRGGADADTLNGGAGNDTLDGGADADTLNGGAGNDALDGGGEADTLNGGAGNDALDGGADADTLNGGAGNDALDGGGEADTLNGGAGADTLTGGAGADTASYRASEAGVTVRLYNGQAGGGHATGDAFAGTDTVTARNGDGAAVRVTVPDIEHLRGSAHDDVLAGDGRANVLHGEGGNDTLYGGPDGGDDTLSGGAGNDRLFGGRGDDTLDGGAGNDVLYGGPGNDVLAGGAGADVFVFAPGGRADTVTDFRSGEDRIDLSAFEAVRSIDDLDLQPGPQGLLIDVTGPDGGALTLTGTAPHQLTDTDFIFAGDDGALLG